MEQRIGRGGDIEIRGEDGQWRKVIRVRDCCVYPWGRADGLPNYFTVSWRGIWVNGVFSSVEEAVEAAEGGDGAT